jgi:hypothetical protein
LLKFLFVFVIFYLLNFPKKLDLSSPPFSPEKAFSSAFLQWDLPWGACNFSAKAELTGDAIAVAVAAVIAPNLHVFDSYQTQSLFLLPVQKDKRKEERRLATLGNWRRGDHLLFVVSTGGHYFVVYLFREMVYVLDSIETKSTVLTKKLVQALQLPSSANICYSSVSVQVSKHIAHPQFHNLHALVIKHLSNHACYLQYLFSLFFILNYPSYLLPTTLARITILIVEFTQFSLLRRLQRAWPEGRIPGHSSPKTG